MRLSDNADNYIIYGGKYNEHKENVSRYKGQHGGI